MSIIRYTKVLAVGAMFVSSFSWAQTANPPATSGSQSTDPSAASTPHQRAATSSSTTETAPGGGTNPSDASTPHQGDQLKKQNMTKAQKHQMMKDCMQKQASDNSSMSKTDMKTACTAQMKSMSDNSMSNGTMSQ